MQNHRLVSSQISELFHSAACRSPVGMTSFFIAKRQNKIRYRLERKREKKIKLLPAVALSTPHSFTGTVAFAIGMQK